MISVKSRYDLLDAQSKLSIRQQSKLLKIDRWKLYYKPKSESAFNLYLMRLIDQKYQVCPFFGVPSMTDYLNGLGLRPINKKRVARLYKKMDIRALGHAPNTSKSDPKSYKYPYLLRNLKVVYPNQVWAADITFLPMRSGYMYLFAIIDLYSRYILAWDISNSMTAKWCKHVFLQAIHWYPTPDIFNTDQGTQFTSQLWTETMIDNGIKISMDGKGRAIDNIFIERFWKTYKYNYLYLNAPNGGQQLFDGSKEFMDFYNFEKPHSSLIVNNKKMTPAEFYFGKKVYFVPTKYSPSVVEDWG